MNWARGRRRKKKAEKERDFFPPLTHKLHQFILGIRLHLKEEKRKKMGNWEGQGRGYSIKMKIGRKKGHESQEFHFCLAHVGFGTPHLPPSVSHADLPSWHQLV